MICRKCGIDKPAGAFCWKTNGKVAYGQDCRTCLKERWASPEWQNQQRNNHLQRLYNITLEEYDELFEKQGGKCALCGEVPKATGKNSRLHVDHDHKTQRVRGLLCYGCNIAIGFLGEDMERVFKVIDYLNINSESSLWAMERGHKVEEGK